MRRGGGNLIKVQKTSELNWGGAKALCQDTITIHRIFTGQNFLFCWRHIFELRMRLRETVTSAQRFNRIFWSRSHERFLPYAIFALCYTWGCKKDEDMS